MILYVMKCHVMCMADVEKQGTEKRKEVVHQLMQTCLHNIIHRASELHLNVCNSKRISYNLQQL